MTRTVREALFVIAALATIAGAVVVLLSTNIVAIVPFRWWGFAACGGTTVTALYVGIEGRALFGEGDDSDEGS